MSCKTERLLIHHFPIYISSGIYTFFIDIFLCTHCVDLFTLHRGADVTIFFYLFGSTYQEGGRMCAIISRVSANLWALRVIA